MGDMGQRAIASILGVGMFLVEAHHRAERSIHQHLMAPSMVDSAKNKAAVRKIGPSALMSADGFEVKKASSLERAPSLGLSLRFVRSIREELGLPEEVAPAGEDEEEEAGWFQEQGMTPAAAAAAGVSPREMFPPLQGQGSVKSHAVLLTQLSLDRNGDWVSVLPSPSAASSSSSSMKSPRGAPSPATGGGAAAAADGGVGFGGETRTPRAPKTPKTPCALAAVEEGDEVGSREPSLGDLREFGKGKGVRFSLEEDKQQQQQSRWAETGGLSARKGSFEFDAVKAEVGVDQKSAEKVGRGASFGSDGGQVPVSAFAGAAGVAAARAASDDDLDDQVVDDDLPFDLAAAWIHAHQKPLAVERAGGRKVVEVGRGGSDGKVNNQDQWEAALAAAAEARAVRRSLSQSQSASVVCSQPSQTAAVAEEKEPALASPAVVAEGGLAGTPVVGGVQEGEVVVRQGSATQQWQSAMRRLMTVRIVCQPSVDMARAGSSMNWYVVQPAQAQP